MRVQTDIQSFFTTQDSTTTQSNDNRTQTRGTKISYHTCRNLVDGLHRQRQLQLSKWQLTKQVQKVTKHRFIDYIAAEDHSNHHVSSIELDAQDAIFALSYCEGHIEIHEFLPFLLQHSSRNDGVESQSTLRTSSKNHHTADTLRLRLHTRQRKHAVSKFSPVAHNLLACGFRNCHTAWLFDLERCSETEPTQVLGKNENLAVGCQNMCFGNDNNASYLACACNDGLGRLYDTRSRQASSACMVLRGRPAQQHLASAILLDDHFVYMGYHSGEMAKFDLRMTESAYATPLHFWNHENLMYENKEILGKISNNFHSAIDDIFKDPFFPSCVIAKNRDGLVMGIDTQRNKVAFLQDNPTSTVTALPTTGKSKRPRIYGIEENVFNQDNFFTQNLIELQEDDRLFSLALRVKRAHRLQCFPIFDRTSANIIFPDPFSSNVRVVDIIECLKKGSHCSARKIPIEVNSLPCAVAIHKPTKHVLVGLLNGKTVVLEL
ncbi:hypothetical protein GpartN1_g613.t1 [Galdieria partita]|uniref:Uncharacterized protein n=1 Tax=Galdieria partita TaxID=83374 RepID=A0A9C7PRR1_9RHOD|nr:hypothetical protein GpartN1_g613.t1 [Galdieria partita]